MCHSGSMQSVQSWIFCYNHSFVQFRGFSSVDSKHNLINTKSCVSIKQQPTRHLSYNPTLNCLLQRRLTLSTKSPVWKDAPLVYFTNFHPFLRQLTLIDSWRDRSPQTPVTRLDDLGSRDGGGVKTQRHLRPNSEWHLAGILRRPRLFWVIKCVPWWTMVKPKSFVWVIFRGYLIK